MEDFFRAARQRARWVPLGQSILREALQRSEAMTNPAVAAAMTAVAAQPKNFRPRPTANRPMIFSLVAISMMIAITGAAMTPLITAVRNSARIGSMGRKLSSTPPIVATAMV